MTRLSKLQAKIQASDLDGLLVTDPVNVGYLTGFTGDESGLLVGETGAWFITDSRFTTQAKQQVTNATLVIHTHGVLRKAAELADDQGMQAVGFESEYMTFADYQKLGAQCSWNPTTNWSLRCARSKTTRKLPKSTRPSPSPKPATNMSSKRFTPGRPSWPWPRTSISSCAGSAPAAPRLTPSSRPVPARPCHMAPQPIR